MINGPSFTIEAIATEGRFLRISIPGAYLSLAEVQIFSGGRDEDWESVAQVSWNPPTCFDPLGYEVYRNDELILELPADAAAFEHTPDRRSTQYRIETIVPNGVDECPAMPCSASNTSIPFDVPLRINFAGPEVVDDEGNVWLGDENSPADLLGIRPNDVNGANHIANWCAPDILSLEELGFDPFGPMASALSSIRWDSDSLNSPFELELAVPEGEYTVNLFFIECAVPTATTRFQSRASSSGKMSTRATSHPAPMSPAVSASTPSKESRSSTRDSRSPSPGSRAVTSTH